MANFSPGPLTCAGPKGEDGYPLYYSSVILDHDEHALIDTDEEICELPDWPFNREEQNANALLFAAAPDMYEALKSVCEQCFAHGICSLSNCDGCSICKALAKAEGRDT